jgi:hypothetical protein
MTRYGIARTLAGPTVSSRQSIAMALPHLLTALPANVDLVAHAPLLISRHEVCHLVFK